MKTRASTVPSAGLDVADDNERTVMVRGRTVRESEVATCGDSSVRVESRLAFRREALRGKGGDRDDRPTSAVGGANSTLHDVPLIKDANGCVLVDTMKVQSSCWALNIQGQSRLEDVEQVCREKMRARAVRRKSLTMPESCSALPSRPGTAPTGEQLGSPAGGVGSLGGVAAAPGAGGVQGAVRPGTAPVSGRLISFLKRNRSAERLAAFRPENYANRVAEMARIRDLKGDAAWRRKEGILETLQQRADVARFMSPAAGMESVPGLSLKELTRFAEQRKRPDGLGSFPEPASIDMNHRLSRWLEILGLVSVCGAMHVANENVGPQERKLRRVERKFWQAWRVLRWIRNVRRKVRLRRNLGFFVRISRALAFFLGVGMRNRYVVVVKFMLERMMSCMKLKYSVRRYCSGVRYCQAKCREFGRWIHNHCNQDLGRKFVLQERAYLTHLFSVFTPGELALNDPARLKMNCPEVEDEVQLQQEVLRSKPGAGRLSHVLGAANKGGRVGGKASILQTSPALPPPPSNSATETAVSHMASFGRSGSLRSGSSLGHLGQSANQTAAMAMMAMRKSVIRTSNPQVAVNMEEVTKRSESPGSPTIPKATRLLPPGERSDVSRLEARRKSVAVTAPGVPGTDGSLWQRLRTGGSRGFTVGK